VVAVGPDWKKETSWEKERWEKEMAVGWD